MSESKKAPSICVPPIVTGKMSLRNRTLNTAVFWGARPYLSRREITKIQQASAIMNNDSQQPSTSAQEIVYVTLDSDDEETNHSEARPEDEMVLQEMEEEDDDDDDDDVIIVFDGVPEIQAIRSSRLLDEDEEEDQSLPFQDLMDHCDPLPHHQRDESPELESLELESLPPSDESLDGTSAQKPTQYNSLIADVLRQVSMKPGKLPAPAPIQESKEAEGQGPSEPPKKKRRIQVKGSIPCTRRSSRIAMIEEKPQSLIGEAPKEERKPEQLLVSLAPPTRKRKRASSPKPGTSTEVSPGARVTSEEPPPKEEKPESLLPKRSRVPKPAGEPSRRSGRINKENETVGEDPLLANFNESNGVTDRGINIPTGLKHIPFEFKAKDEDRLKNKLRINMQPVFTPAGALAQGFPADTEKPKTSKPKDKSAEPTDAASFMNRAHGEIHIGAEFQVEVPDDVIDQDRREEVDRDEAMWSPPSFEDDFYFKTLRETYWRAIWRQYESQIPMEVALKHLMEAGFNMGKSLDTIDQELLTLPQKFKPLGAAQVKHFTLNKKKTRRVVQEKAMRNYHISEVQAFNYRYRTFFKYQKKNGVACNCDEPLCEKLEFEPRWACFNCTRSMRPKADPEKNCLICTAYKQLTGRKRNCKDLILNEEDAQKIQKWRELEDKSGKAMSREEFEKALEAETIARWRREELTAEEHAMLYKKEIKKSDDRAEKIVEQLKPWVLPHFTRCNCKSPMTDEQLAIQLTMSRKPVPMKDSFNVREQDNYCIKLWDNNYNIPAACKELKIPIQHMVSFLEIYGAVYQLEEAKASLPASDANCPPPSGEAPPLPELGHSRDNSPYLPPGEKRKRKSN